MDKDNKKNIKKGIIFILLSFLMFIPVLILDQMHQVQFHAWNTLTPQILIENKISHQKEEGVVKKQLPEKKTSSKRETLKEKGKQNKTGIWNCKPPRELWQGSGWVKECEWK